MSLAPRFPLTTPRLVLRPLGVDDVDALVAYHSSAEVHRFLPLATMDAETITDRITSGPWSYTTLETEGDSIGLGVARPTPASSSAT